MNRIEIIENEKLKCSGWLNKNLNSIHVASILIISFIIILFGIGKMEIKFSVINKIHLYENVTNQSESESSFNISNELIIYKKRFDVVLSYYTEDVNYVARYIRYLRDLSILKKLTIRIIVYNKNAQIDVTYLKDVLKADKVILLENLGREGATFLNHIINNYENLSDHIIFSQAGVEGMTNNGLSDWFYNRLDKQFNSSVGYMPLVVDSMISVYDCGQHPSGHFQRLVDLWGMLQQTLCPLGGQAVTQIFI